MRANRLKRREVLAGAGSAALAAGLARPAVAQAAGPLRIGLLTSLSGPFTSLGESMRAGLELQIADAQGQMGGRPVELLVEEITTDPPLLPLVSIGGQSGSPALHS